MTRELPGYEVAPWELRWRWLDLDALRKTESTFALSNGHIGFRGSFEEGEPRGLPGTYLNGVYETRPLPYAEAGYGFPEDGQTVVNVTNGKVIRLLVDDEPFDVRYGDLLSHRRVLDMRAGTLERVHPHLDQPLIHVVADRGEDPIRRTRPVLIRRLEQHATIATR